MSLSNLIGRHQQSSWWFQGSVKAFPFLAQEQQFELQKITCLGWSCTCEIESNPPDGHPKDQPLTGKRGIEPPPQPS